MGFKAWRNLGILALAGAALVGCTSTTPQNSKITTPTPPNNNAWNTPANQPPPPNANVFGANQQFAPQANGGLDAQSRSNTPGFPPTTGPAGFNTNSGPQISNGANSAAPGLSPTGNSSNVNYLTTPNPSLPQPGFAPQPFFNPALQGSNANPGATSPPIGNALPSAGAAPPNLQTPPSSLSPANPGNFTPPPAPSGFGTSR